MQPYSSQKFQNANGLYSRQLGLCSNDPPFSKLAKVITKIALEGVRAVQCIADWRKAGKDA